MTDNDTVRPGEMAVGLPEQYDASVTFIGRIRTPFQSRHDCPKNTGESDALGTVDIEPRYASALKGVELFSHLILLYWMDEARRDLVQQVPAHLGEPRGTFALRSPVRPNPIGVGVVELIGVDGASLTVRGVDCRDGTPLIDIKPYFASTDSIPHARRPERR